MKTTDGKNFSYLDGPAQQMACAGGQDRNMINLGTSTFTILWTN
jgi:hypothetical protein